MSSLANLVIVVLPATPTALANQLVPLVEASPTVVQMIAQVQPTPTPESGSGGGLTIDASFAFNGLVAACAVVALVLSIFQEIDRRRSKKPRVRVRLRTGLLGLPTGGMSDIALIVEAANIGEKLVTLSIQATVNLPNDKKALMPEANRYVSFPYALEPGLNCVTWIYLRDLAQILNKEGVTGKYKIVGWYQDLLGNIYKSKPYKFDVAMWLRPTAAESTT